MNSNSKFVIPIERYNRIYSILKRYYQRIKNIPAYLEYNEQVQTENRLIDREAILNDTQQELNILKSKLEGELKDVSIQIESKKYPNKDERLLTALEFNNALLLASKTCNFEPVISQAIKQNRLEFVHYALDLLSNSKELQPSESVILKQLKTKVDEFTGVRDKEVVKDELSKQLQYISDLMNLDSDMFDNNIQMIHRSQTGRIESGEQIPKEVLL